MQGFATYASEYGPVRVDWQDDAVVRLRIIPQADYDADGAGETTTYAQIAEAVGHPKAVRAVGSANNRNPIPFIVPCHRVVGANGNLVGYAYGVEMKRSLLQMEMRTLGQ